MTRNQEDEGLVPKEASAPFDDDAYLQTLRERLPRKSQEILVRLNRVYDVYVSSRRDKILAEAFEAFIEDFLTTRSGRRKEADIFFLTGESGAGKTEAVGRLLRENPVIQPYQASYGTIYPYISLKLPGYLLPRIVATQIIAKSGDRIKPGTKQGDAWAEISPALKRRRVILVHLDEVQHLIRDDGTDLSRIADAIKGVSIASDWPVAFLLSGLPSIKALAQKDEQFERRARWVHFPDLKMPEQKGLVVRILQQMTVAAGLGLGAMSESDMPARIAHASRYRYARVCQLVVAAIHQALRAEDSPKDLLRGHFALAYAGRSRSRDHNLMNPFLIDDWELLDAGTFLDIEGPEEEED